MYSSGCPAYSPVRPGEHHDAADRSPDRRDHRSGRNRCRQLAGRDAECGRRRLHHGHDLQMGHLIGGHGEQLRPLGPGFRCSKTKSSCSPDPPSPPATGREASWSDESCSASDTRFLIRLLDRTGVRRFHGRAPWYPRLAAIVRALSCKRRAPAGRPARRRDSFAGVERIEQAGGCPR